MRVGDPVSDSSPRPGLADSLVGRCFVNPLFDYALIGGGLSLVVLAPFYWSGSAYLALGPDSLAIVLLVSTGAHFAASTVRLYTKPDAAMRWPFLTLGLPLVAVAGLTLCILFPQAIGWHLYALYLSWSPFHYARQAFGLSSMYCERSGCRLSTGEKRAITVTCMLPFLYALFATPGAGIDWFGGVAFIEASPQWSGSLALALEGLRVVAFALPALLFAWLWRSGRPMPLISLLMIVANGIWWLTLNYISAFVWVTVFHGIQYLAIVLVFHVRERMADPRNRRSAAFHVVSFYLMSLLLAFGLFHGWPHLYVWAGRGLAESMLLTVATINVHHFIVDAYIWRVGRDTQNARIVRTP